MSVFFIRFVKGVLWFGNMWWGGCRRGGGGLRGFLKLWEWCGVFYWVSGWVSFWGVIIFWRLNVVG